MKSAVFLIDVDAVEKSDFRLHQQPDRRVPLPVGRLRRPRLACSQGWKCYWGARRLESLLRANLYVRLQNLDWNFVATTSSYFG